MAIALTNLYNRGMSSGVVAKSELRKGFAGSLASMFAAEVPEYTRFAEIVRQSNEAYLQSNPNAIVDNEDRVFAEKHGAIRVGTAYEMRIVTRIFDVFGMQPVEFYDLTQLPKGSLPMVATAFRPVDSTIEHSAFRMFCSMLHPDKIPSHLSGQVQAALKTRNEGNPKFSEKLLSLLGSAESKGGLTEEEAAVFIVEVVNSLRIDKNRVIDFSLYKALRQESDVYADIVCLGINLNHLTPRAYDIEDAAKRLADDGIPMKDGGIEGPPIRYDAPNIQLNQTSRKAPGEGLYVSNNPEQGIGFDAPRIDFLDGEDVQAYLDRVEEALKENPVVVIQHKARFGEIESRATALTIKGEGLYRELLAAKKYKTDFPKTHLEMFKQGLAYYSIVATSKSGASSSADLLDLVEQGYLELVPQTYNDFLAASAAGIFKSNLSAGAKVGVNNSPTQDSAGNLNILQEAMGKDIIDRHSIHKAEEAESIAKAYQDLGLKMGDS